MSTTTVRNGVVTCLNAVVVTPTPLMTVRGCPRFSVRVTVPLVTAYVSTATSEEESVWNVKVFALRFSPGDEMQIADRSSRSNDADRSRAASMASALRSMRFDALCARKSVEAAIVIPIDITASVIISSIKVVPLSRMSVCVGLVVMTPPPAKCRERIPGRNRRRS